MHITAPYIEDRIRTAAQLEVRDSDQQLFADLQNIVSPEAVEQGFAIDFGSDQDAFAKTTDALNIDRQLATGDIHIHTALVGHDGMTSYIGSAIPMLGQLGIVRALDVAQTDGMETYKLLSLYNRIKTSYDSMASRFVIANAVKDVEGGPALSDTTLPGIVVGVEYRYLPELFDGWETGSAANLIADIKKKAESPSRGVGMLAAHLVQHDLDLLMPERRYSMAIGTLAADATIMRSIDSVQTSRSYTLLGGRLVRESHPYDETE